MMKLDMMMKHMRTYIFNQFTSLIQTSKALVWSDYDWPVDLFLDDLRTVIDLRVEDEVQGTDAYISSFIAWMFGFTEGEEIRFNGRNLEGSDVYMFTLEDSKGPLWNLTEQEGKVVVLAFIFTRCDNTWSSYKSKPQSCI